MPNTLAVCRPDVVGTPRVRYKVVGRLMLSLRVYQLILKSVNFTLNFKPNFSSIQSFSTYLISIHQTSNISNIAHRVSKLAGGGAVSVYSN